MNWNLFFTAITALGSLAAVASLVWAIYSFRRANETKTMAALKKEILSYPGYCRKIDRLLAEPFFSAIGNSISEELQGFMPDNQSLEEFSNEFMLNPEADNFKALAIYTGMKKCSEIKEIADVIESLDSCQRNIISKLPLLGRVFSDLSLYIVLPAERTITTRILNMNLKFIVDGEENEGLKRVISEALETSSRELYFKRIALHLTGAISANLKKNSYGQGSITLSCKMINVLAKRFESISDRVLKNICKMDQKKIPLIQQTVSSHEYSVEIAMELLKQHKNLYSEDEWDSLIECKGGILQLMKEKE
jgi:hypothetical protein